MQSRAALNATNFFLADMTAVVMPFLATFLRAHGWRYDAIGLAAAVHGFGVLALQTPAGLVIDRSSSRRLLLALTSILVGVAYAVLPLVPARRPVAVDALLFAAGAASAFFAPLLGALALGLAGRERLDRTVGANQSWNHLGNIAAAAAALWLVGLDLNFVFYSIVAVSLLAVVSVTLIRRRDIDERLAAGGNSGDGDHALGSIRVLLRDRRVAFLLAATALFHLANAPVMPLVALAVKHVGGGERQVALVVLIAQAVMVPVAWFAGRSCERFGRKWTLAVGFFVLPLRIASYALARAPASYLLLQSLDGVGAGICGVAVVSVCADLTRGKGSFNTLIGLIATAPALGGVVGPLLAGFLVQHVGFSAAFLAFAGIAAGAAALFQIGVPETRRTLEARLPAPAASGAL